MSSVLDNVSTFVERTNRYGVNVTKWNGWSPQARIVFNNVYENMSESQWAFIHPNTREVPEMQWLMTAWNAAWVAADAADLTEAR